MNVFLDANVFFSAARSPEGGSAFVLALAKSGRIMASANEYVLWEAERNLRNLGYFCLLNHYQNITDSGLMIYPTRGMPESEVRLLRSYVLAKDIPVLIGALQSKADVLITLDKKHLLDNQGLKLLDLPFKIMNPAGFLQTYF